MESGMILPDVEDVDTAPFWAAARDQKLVAQKCGGCGRLRLPPHPFCGACQSEAVSWVDLSGRAKLWSFVVHHGPTMPAYAPFAPFPVVVVELDEDKRLRLTGNIVAKPGAAINSVDPTTLKIGMPLKVTFQQVADDVTLPYWTAA
jgi:uncharacterized OB-fold protein